MTATPPILSSTIPSDTRIDDLTILETGTGPLVVCVDFYARVATWDPVRDEWNTHSLAFACAADPLAADYPDAENQLNWAAVTIHDGRRVLAAGGDEQGFAFWDLDTGELLRGTTFDAAYAAAVVAVRGGKPLFVTAEQYSDAVHVWDPAALDSPRELAGERRVYCLDAVHAHGMSCIAVGGSDEGVELWDLATGRNLVAFDTDDERVHAVSIARIDGIPAVTAAIENKILAWDITGSDDDDPFLELATGHDGEIQDLDTALVDGRTIAVTGGADATVRLWDLTAGTALGGPLTGHEWAVEAVRTTRLRGRDVAVSACRDGKVHVWDLDAALPG